MLWEKQRKNVVEDVEKLKTINEIVPIAVNSNSSQGPSISGVVSCKMKRDSVSTSTMINLQAQGFKIIDSNILQGTLNVVGRCTSCGEQKLQISENVNKRIGMCENLVLCCLGCKKDIYSFLTSPQVEKEEQGTMHINLRYADVVTSLGGGLTSLRNLCMHFGFPQPLAEHSYQSYLKYLEKLTEEVKKEDCIGHVQKRLGTAYVVIINYGVQFYLMAKYWR